MRLARTIVACGLLALVGLFCAGSTSWAEQPRVVVRIGVQPNILPDVILRARKTLESKYGDRYDFQWIDTTHAGAAIEAMVAAHLAHLEAGLFTHLPNHRLLRRRILREKRWPIPEKDRCNTH